MACCGPLPDVLIILHTCTCPLLKSPAVLQLHERLHEIEAEVARAPTHKLVVVCRRGNDSQRAADALIKHGVDNVYDLRGGLHAWAQQWGDVAAI